MLAAFLIVVGGLGLLAALLAFWQSLRAAFGATDAWAAGSFVTESERRTALFEEKRALLASIKDLEFEKDAGKISADDFARLNRALRDRATDVLRLLDEDVKPYREKAEKLIAKHIRALEHPSPYRGARGATDAAAGAEGADEVGNESEAEVAAAPAPVRARNPFAPPDPDEEAEAAEDAAPAPAPDRVTCAKCETENDADATFCKRCGAKMTAEQEAAADDDERGDA
jgi:hypothetical protein